MIQQKILDHFFVPPGKKVRLKDYFTGWDQIGDLEELGKDVVKEKAREKLA